MRKKGYLLLLLLALLAVLLFFKIYGDTASGQYQEDKVGIGELKAELAFGIYTQEEWTAYFNTFQKDYLTGEMLRQLLEKLGVASYIETPAFAKHHAVSRQEWAGIYAQILDLLDMERAVKIDTVLVLGKMEAAEKNVIITNLGDFYTALPVTYFDDWGAYRIYTMEEECLGISEVSAEETTVFNAYLKQQDEETVTFLFGGAEYQKETKGLEAKLEAGVCDLIFAEGRISTIRMKQDVIEGELLSYDDAAIEIESYGKLKHEGKIPVYQTYGEIAEKSISDIVLGNMKVTYVTGEDQICAILIVQPAAIKNIRVLLLGDNGSKFRSDIYLKCGTDAAIQCGDRTETAAAGTLVHVKDYLSQDAKSTLTLKPVTEEGMIIICDENGEAKSNGYSGSVEVRGNSEGYTLVNQLPFETYLSAVVPSEMPSSYEPEALKAQAVCARSYAYMQLLRADLAEYGAHIDDSTSYQVYNKSAQTENSLKAVKETAGEVLTYQGNTIEAYYFSTSMGYTDTAAVWNVEDDAGYGYLKAVCLNESEYEGNLSEESQFLSYIQKPGSGYDGTVKYSRWMAEADFRGKTAEINGILKARRSVSEKNIQYLETDGKTEKTSLDGMGEIKKLSVEKRSGSGAILTLRIQYEQGMAMVKTEYNIRKVLGCGVSKITYADHSEGGSTAMLPSAFCTVSALEDGTYLLFGGGYGHGLGMSQNGANGMAKAGINYKEILQYFYNDIKIEQMK